MEPSTFKGLVQSITISFQGCYCLHPPALFCCLPLWQHFGLSRILTWQWGILLIREGHLLLLFLAFYSSGGRCKFLIYLQKSGLVDQFFYLMFFFCLGLGLGLVTCRHVTNSYMHLWLCSIIYTSEVSAY